MTEQLLFLNLASTAFIRQVLVTSDFKIKTLRSTHVGISLMYCGYTITVSPFGNEIEATIPDDELMNICGCVLS